MYRTVFMFALVVISIVDFTSGEWSGRIVGGFPVSIKSIPYQASLQVKDVTWHKQLRHVCGASIISEKWLLTAAHCIVDVIPQNLKILVGSSYRNRGGKKLDVLRIIKHQNYNRQNQDYDIALLELSNRLTFSHSIRPITLPNANERIADGTMCLASGYGDTQQFLLRSNVLRAVEVPIVNQTKCNNNYKMLGGITPRMLCAGYESGGFDSCGGDSGGPLACAGQNGSVKLQGVVSWGYGCGAPHFMGIYSKVSVLRDWIQEKTGI